MSNVAEAEFSQKLKATEEPSEAIKLGLKQLERLRELQEEATLRNIEEHKDGGNQLARGKSYVLSGLKRKVSKKKRRFEAGSLSLDLTYITDRVIAMGFPSQGVESIYRNAMPDVRAFLDERHRDHYKVYNLCSERHYDPSNFHDRVFRYPFDDHNCPPFDSMHNFLRDVDEWMSQDPSNVVVIHCKAGKGRTGVTIATYLMHIGMWHTSAEALSFYGFVRTCNSKGVTIPSQRRWVDYYGEYMTLKQNGEDLPEPKNAQLVKIFISSGAPKFDQLSIRCDEQKLKLTSSSSWSHKWRDPQSDGGECLDLTPLDISLVKDVHIAFKVNKLLKKATIFGMWFNTRFTKHGYLRFKKSELDKVNKKKKADEFYVELFFDNYDAKQVELDIRMNEEAEKRRNDIVENMKAHFGFVDAESSDSNMSQTELPHSSSIIGTSKDMDVSGPLVSPQDNWNPNEDFLPCKE